MFVSRAVTSFAQLAHALSCYSIPHDTPLELDTGKREVALVHGMKAYGGERRYTSIHFYSRHALGRLRPTFDLDVVDRKMICVPVGK